MYHDTSAPFVLMVQLVVLRASTTVLQYCIPLYRYVGFYYYWTLVLSIE